MQTFVLFPNKGDFQIFMDKNLSERLLKNSYLSLNTEKKLVLMLKQEEGSYYTKNMTRMLSDIDKSYKEFEEYHKLKNEFYPVPGEYTVARFLSFSYDQGMESSFETNNVLILKIDENKRIIDGYIYCLQWAEVPVSQALFRITNNRIKIKNRQSISPLFTYKKNNANGKLKRHKGFLVVPNNIEILKSNFIDKKDQKIYSYEPNEFMVSEIGGTGLIPSTTQVDSLER